MIGRIMSELYRFRNGSIQLAKIKACTTYLKSIKTLRVLSMNVMGIGACLFVGLVGFVLLHLGLFAFTPWTAQTKMWLAFGLAVLYMAGGIAVCTQLMSQKTWMGIFNVQELVNDVLDKK